MVEVEPNFKFKIVLLGNPGVGKTSLVYRFIENKFRSDYKSTLGVNLLKKEIKYNEKVISLQIWDLGGQESFRSLRKLYLEGSHGGFLVFDLTNKKSFEDLPEWMGDFKNIRGELPLILIGNKRDLSDSVQVEDGQVEEFAKTHDLTHYITSAKTGEGVEDAFLELTKSILELTVTNV
ncbi:MAG: Rab family GTPase [Promethearchaeota archaeon]